MAKRKKSKKRDTGKDLQVVILIVISVLLALAIYVKSGYMGETLSPMLGGLVGWIKYIIPIATFMVAISMVSEENRENITKKFALPQ